MEITYICHSAFLVELPQALLLFDYFEGDLPPLPTTKPLYLFASHSHGDHFHRRIFEIPHPNKYYFLAHEIRRTLTTLEREQVTAFVRPGESVSHGILHLFPLRSTDRGVAFSLTLGGQTLYHGGDLNNWHWVGEPLQWLSAMEKRYLAELKKLQGTHFTLAFVPLDPRLGEFCTLGLTQFLENATATHLFPMHLWGDYSPIDAWNRSHDQQLYPLHQNGQRFTL